MLVVTLFLFFGLLWIVRGVDPLLILIDCLIHLRAAITGAVHEARIAGRAWWRSHPERVRAIRREVGA